MLFLLVFVYAVSTAVRYHQHNVILHSSVHNIDGHTILSGNDGYRWLRYAREIGEGSYVAGGEDKLSGSPEHVNNPPVKPLLSVLINKLSTETGKSPEEASGLLTVFLSGLFIFPLGGLLMLDGLAAASVGGAVIGALGFAYLSRTAGFQPDTDMLNLFFPLCVLFCIRLTSYRPYLFSALAGASSYLFFQWYYHAGFLPVWVLILIVYMFLDGRSFRETALSCSLLIALSGPDQIMYAIGSASDFFASRGHESSVYISELKVRGFADSLRMLTFDGWTALFGIVVSVILIRRMWLLLPLLILGLMMFFRGERYGMYLGIFAGIGIGCALDMALMRMRGRIYLASTLTMFICLMLVRHFMAFVPAPYISKQVFDGIYRLNVPSGDVVVSHWDYGYLIEYLKKAVCASDGSTQYKKGRELTDSLMASESNPVEKLRSITGGREAYIVVTGADGAKFVKDGFYAESYIPSVNNFADGQIVRINVGSFAKSEKYGALMAKYDQKRSKMMVFNNKTLKSFFGKIYIIDTANVYCIHSDVLSQPSIRVYVASESCLDEK